MDGKSFDSLVRDLGRSMSRRLSLAGAGAALLSLGVGGSTRAKHHHHRRKHKKVGGTDKFINLCCEYLCAPTQTTKAHYCIENAIEGQTRCDGSLPGCSFSTAFTVGSCDQCPTP